jgi:hypothetical protein
MDRTEYKSAIWFSIFVLGVSPGIVCVCERERASFGACVAGGWVGSCSIISHSSLRAHLHPQWQAEGEKE